MWKKYYWRITSARIWTAGCIIKSDLMIELVEVFKRTDSILKDETVIEQIKALKPSANKVVSHCILNELPISCLSESVNFFNVFVTANSSANIIQAQRDFFGAHT